MLMHFFKNLHTLCGVMGRIHMYIMEYVHHNSSSCHAYITWVELGHSQFSLAKCNVGRCKSIFLSLITREKNAKNNFQRRLLFITRSLTTVLLR